MKKNILPEILKMYGIEPLEKFRVVQNNKYKEGVFWFSQITGLINEIDGQEKNADDVFNKICTGRAEIIKIPWQPKEGETFYYPDVVTGSINADKFNSQLMLHMSLKALKVVYRERGEASEAFPEDYNKITGKKWDPMSQIISPAK